MNEELEHLFRGTGGAIRRSDHPKFEQRLDRLYHRGLLERPLPGVFALPGVEAEFDRAVIAGALWAGPDAVLVGAAAAKLTFWPKLRVEEIEYAIPIRRVARSGKWTKAHRKIPQELVVHRGPIRITCPALTAVDLAACAVGGNAIDEALRTGAATLEQLWAAFAAQPDRPGNSVRRMLLVDSRDSPWSEGERELHRVLRAGGITGWRTNQSIKIGRKEYRGDVLFEKLKVIAEVDGWEYHGTRDAFENDRRRRNELEAAGYLVLNFTWLQVTRSPDWVVDCIRRALRRRA